MATGNPTHANRACLACKEKKIRCLMSDGPPWVCQRCTRKMQECIIPELRPRPRKKKVYERRIEQLERHVERVMSLLEKPTPSVTPSASTTSETAQRPRSALDLAVPPPVDVISDDVITVEEAETLLREYRDQMADNFPYVVLPEATSLSNLRQGSPMLLLAILVTASWRNRAQQEVLNQAYLKLFSSRLILEGRKDLDLLQGLMVYLTWIHLHLTPKTQQVYRLASITAAIAIDSGITQRPGKGQHQQMNVENTTVVPTGLMAVSADFWNREAQRAYLGCYHISIWYSILTRKVCPMVYNDYLHACARSLAAAKEVPSDANLVYQLELNREAERVYEVFNYAETNQSQNMSDEQMQVYLNAFSSEVNEWRERIPPSLAEDACQQLWPRIFEAFVREIGLYGLSRSPHLSIPRITILLDSLMHTKNYLDTFLTIPLNRLASFTSTQWSLLHYSILLVTTVSLSTQTPVWNIGAARSIIKLETYLDAVSARLRELSSSMSSVEGLSDWYGGLLIRWDSIKTRYLMALQRSQPEMNTQTSPVPAGAPQHMEVLSSQIPSTQAWLGSSQYQVTDSAYVPMAGFELLDFANNVGSWMLPNVDPSSHEAVHFSVPSMSPPVLRGPN